MVDLASFKDFIGRRGLADRFTDAQLARVMEPGALLLSTGSGGREQSRIAVDLDGTLAHDLEPFDHAKVGPPRPGAQEFVRQLRKLAKQVVIVTARENLAPVKAWVKANGILVDGVTNQKMPAILYIDNRGLRAEGDLAGTLRQVQAMIGGKHLSTGQWERIELSVADVIGHPLQWLAQGYRSLLEQLKEEPDTPEEDRSTPDEIDRYLMGEWLPVVSSNLTAIRFLPDEEAVEVEFNGGRGESAFYRYSNVDLALARAFAEAPSPGRFVWDVFRKRGTSLGYNPSHPYVFVSGISSHEPKWMRSAETRRLHGMIGSSGPGAIGPGGTMMSTGEAYSDWLEFASQTAIQLATDASGHEHRGRGPGGGQFTGSHPHAAYEAIPAGELGKVEGFPVFRMGESTWRLETPTGFVQGHASDVHQHIEQLKQQEEKARPMIDAALKRAAEYPTYNPFTHPTESEAEEKAFTSLPEGALVVSLDPNSKGRLGKIVKHTDDSGHKSTRVRLYGVPGFVSTDVEPLDRGHSWRVKANRPQADLSKKKQGFLFSLSQDLAEHYSLFDPADWGEDEPMLLARKLHFRGEGDLFGAVPQWVRDPGPRSQDRWRSLKTGRIVYQAEQPGEHEHRGEDQPAPAASMIDMVERVVEPAVAPPSVIDELDEAGVAMLHGDETKMQRVNRLIDEQHMKNLAAAGNASVVHLRSSEDKGGTQNIFITPSTKEHGRWQMTWTDKDAVPFGDTQFDTMEEAIASASGKSTAKGGPPYGDRSFIVVKTQGKRTPSATPAIPESAIASVIESDTLPVVPYPHPLEITAANVEKTWKAMQEEIVNHDPKLSPNQAGALAAARILNGRRKAVYDFVEAIDAKVGKGEPITDEEDAKYIEVQEGAKGLRTKLEILSGYRPYQDLDENPLTNRPFDAKPLANTSDEKQKENNKATRPDLGESSPTPLPTATALSTFVEAEHPRGQPENAGEFGPGGRGSKPASSATKERPVALPHVDPSADTLDRIAKKQSQVRSKPGDSPPPSSTPEDRSVAVATLTNKGVSFRSKLGGGANVSEKIKLSDGTEGVFKPAAGEEPNLRKGVAAGTYWRREVASYQVAEALGLGDLVPPTTARKLGDKSGSVQKFVRGATVAHDLENPWDGSQDLARAAVFDYLTGHLDRHQGNWMQTGDGKLVLIDNGLAFPTKHEERDFFNLQLLHQAYRDDLKIPGTSQWKEKWGSVEAALVKCGLEPEAIALTKQRFDSLINAAGGKFDDLPGLVHGRRTVAHLLVRAEERERNMA